MTINVLPDANESQNNTIIIEKVQFAYDLFKENPECLEYQEIIAQANIAFEEGKFEKASSLLESAITACKETVTSISGADIEFPTYTKDKIDYSKFIYLATILCLIVWLFMSTWHTKPVMHHKKIKVHKQAKVKKKTPHRSRKTSKKQDIWKK